MLFKLIGAEQSGYVKSLSNIAALFNFKGCVYDLDLAGPFGLSSGNLDLGADVKLCIIRFGACHVVDEVSAVLILGVNGCLILPP